MLWEEYIDLHRYWKKYPPTHIIAAMYVGYKPNDAPEEKVAINQDLAIEEMMAMFGVQIVPKEKLLGMGEEDGRQAACI